MDEATSALDGVTENAVMDAIRVLGRSKTIVVVAHRLATVEECDTLYVLENGRITASGTYEELMRSSDVFRRMARRVQSTVTIEEKNL
jgi:ATP-binding cassette, subfamily B, bacterial PglK